MMKLKIHKTIILPLLLHVYHTWPRSFREEYKLQMFENKAFRKLFGAKKKGIYDLYSNSVL
jgi:hypothetical protein